MNEPDEDDDFPPEEYGEPVGSTGSPTLVYSKEWMQGQWPVTLPVYMESWDA